MRTELTPEKIEQIKKDRSEGMSFENLSRKYHICKNRVIAICGKYVKPERKCENVIVKNPDYLKAQALRDAGWDVYKIADEIGTTPEAIVARTHAPETKRKYSLEWTSIEGDENLTWRDKRSEF